MCLLTISVKNTLPEVVKLAKIAQNSGFANKAANESHWPFRHQQPSAPSGGPVHWLAPSKDPIPATPWNHCPNSHRYRNNIAARRSTPQCKGTWRSPRTTTNIVRATRHRRVPSNYVGDPTFSQLHPWLLGLWNTKSWHEARHPNQLLASNPTALSLWKYQVAVG